ncbi:MAG: lycopene cyclase, partial [Dietzia sp.]|nr:lycopene cyclase [Dietzia sp.]
LRVLLRADARTLRQLFCAFGRIDARRKRWFLDGARTSYKLALAMWDMWVIMPARDKVGMIAAVVRRRPRPAVGARSG